MVPRAQTSAGLAAATKVETQPQPQPQPVVLVTSLGVYTAPLTELIWALYRQRGLCVTSAYVVTDGKGHRYLEHDLLKDGRVLDELRESLDPKILPSESLNVRVARLGAQVISDDLSPEHAACFRNTLWCAAKDAFAQAGEHPVIFGLCGGARRTATALQAAFFQLLARERDQLFDVRVSDARVEPDVAFFFPEQQTRFIDRGHSRIDARRVKIQLIELDLPRLQGVLDGNRFTTYDSALATTRARSPSSLPMMDIDLSKGQVYSDGTLIDLSIAERFWYAYLASRRGDSTDGWVVAGQSGHADFQAFLEASQAHRWARSIRTRPLRRLMDGEFVHDEDLRNMRGKTVQRLKRWCAANRPELAHYLVPESDGKGHQRIPLPAHRIKINPCC